MNGYVDTAGLHFVASVDRKKQDGLAAHPSHYALIEKGKEAVNLDLPNAGTHEWKDVPTLLVDAKGKQHLIAYFPAGEHPNVRDYPLGSDDEPTVIRAPRG